jgi:hypothetical protein
VKKKIKINFLKIIKMTETVPIPKLLDKMKQKIKNQLKWNNSEAMKDNLWVDQVDRINLVNLLDSDIIKEKTCCRGKERAWVVLLEVIIVQSLWAWCSSSIRTKFSPWYWISIKNWWTLVLIMLRFQTRIKF